MPKMPVPFNDDVAAYEITKGNLVVLKTDMLVGKTDVPRSMTLWQAARKAMIMNISDFAAKGVQPISALVSLGLPRNLNEKDVEQIGEGLNAGARQYDAYIIGGDTGEASDLVIAIALFGVAKKGTLMLRKGAKPGDIVAVTGAFGKTSAGLRILTQKFEAAGEIKKVLVNSVVMPNARLKEGLALRQTRAVTAAIDSSDGLAWSLHEIAKASGVGISLEELPIAVEARRFALANKIDPATLAFYGGEEYELVLTVKSEMWRKAEMAVERTGGSLLRIGKVTSDTSIVFETSRKRTEIPARGYEHFRK
jgi:thiamine-monophosphate kinase